jgi:electron transport complex protein RnfB
MMGNPCKKTSREETCMPIGEMAKHAIENGMGREISREEALEIARMNEAEGLVFQPSNARKVDFICSCCGCCCGMLSIQKMLPKPVGFWATNFYATVNAEACTGCGNCVVTCPSGAMSLLKKKKETVPPRDTEALYDEIMAHKKGTIGRMILVAKLMLKR